MKRSTKSRKNYESKGQDILPGSQNLGGGPPKALFYENAAGLSSGSPDCVTAAGHGVSEGRETIGQQWIKDQQREKKTGSKQILFTEQETREFPGNGPGKKNQRAPKQRGKGRDHRPAMPQGAVQGTNTPLWGNHFRRRKWLEKKTRRKKSPGVDGLNGKEEDKKQGKTKQRDSGGSKYRVSGVHEGTKQAKKAHGAIRKMKKAGQSGTRYRKKGAR